MAKAIPVNVPAEASVAPVAPVVVVPVNDSLEAIRDAALAEGKQAVIMGNMVRIDA